MRITALSESLQAHFGTYDLVNHCGQLTLTVPAKDLLSVCKVLKEKSDFDFEQLMDVCGVDYLDYGASEWSTQIATKQGFSRAVDASCTQQPATWSDPRFAVVYHLLSLQNNHRLRLRVFVPEEPQMLDSVVSLWPSANWFEREVFDLFGILFNGHPDLRRILTDYGFIGHPFRKDFPQIGEVEMRYDATEGRCVYEPVSIQPRTLVPKVIRSGNRYLQAEGEVNGAE